MIVFIVLISCVDKSVKFKLRSGMGANSIGKVNCKTTKALDNCDHVNLSTGGSSGSSNCQSDNIGSNALDAVSASIGSVCAESAAVALTCGALLPADGTIS